MDEDWDEELKNEPERKNFDYTSTYSSQQNEDKNNEQRSFGRGQRVGRESAFGNSNFGRGRGRGNNQSRGRGGNWRDNSRGQFDNDRPSWRNDEVNGFDNSMSSDRGRGGFSGNNSMSSDRGRGGFDGNNSMSSDRGGFRNNGMSSDRGGFRGNRNMSSDSSRVFETVEVLNDSIGKLIGRGGSKIREIQDTSGARVTINQDDASNSLTPVKISGTREQVEKAQQMIKDATIPAGDLKAWAEREDRKYADEQPQGGFKINWKQLKQDAETYERTRWAGLPKVIKNIYNEKENIANMSHEEAEAIRLHKNNITCQDLCVDEKRKIPNPVLTFEDAFLEHPEILETIYNNKFQEPSPIQSQAWPILLSGMDCIGIAQTGTGKTLAFLLPAFLHIDQQPVPRHERGGPSCLVLSPTRELAQQIESEVKKFHYRNIRSICIYGGGDRHKQIKELQQGVEIVIGTPGRLNDLLMNNFFKVTSVTYLILDEADRMLDMGFEPEIKKILLDIRPDRQTIMTSATWLPGVQRIADQYLKNPIRVNVGSLDLQACHDVTQLVEFIDLQNKQNRTLEFIQSMEPEDKLIIFVGRKITADDISSNFALMDIEVGIQCIHGDRDQLDREQALADLKSGKARVLIATDVASRGLDVKDLTHVLNYDFPRHIEDYVHRIGRTGRAGRTGCALTFVTREDWMHVGKLIPIMEEAGQEIPIELYEMAQRWDKQREERRSAYGGGRGGGRDGNSRGCFKCGKEGHFSRECPEGGGGGGGGGGFGGRPRRDKRNVGMRVLACDAV